MPRYLPARLGVRLGLLDAAVARDRERLVHRRLVIPGIDVDLCAAGGRPEPGRVLVRELVRLDEVPSPKLGAVHADLRREQVHRPLDDVRRLWPAGAAVGVHEHGVRVDAGDLGVDVGDPVAAVQDPGVERRRDARADRRQAAAEVGQRLDPEPRDLTLAGARDLEMGDVVAAMDRALVVLAPAFDPLDRPATERLAGEQDECVIGVAEDLRAEGATDIGADAADLVLGHAHDERRQQQPLDVRRLARHPDRVLVGARVVPADVAADLHRVRDQALVDDPLADDDLGVVDGGVRAGLVADAPLEDDVVRGVLVELRRARLHRLLGVDDGGQRLVVDDDRVEGVVGLRFGVGDDRGDALTGPLDAVGREDPWRIHVVLETSAAAGRPGHGQRVVRDVGTDEDRSDTGHRLGRRDVDRADVGVRVRAAQDGHVGHRGELDVVDVVAGTGDEARVLDPLDAFAQDVGGHRRSSSPYAPAAAPDRMVSAAWRIAATMFW